MLAARNINEMFKQHSQEFITYIHLHTLIVSVSMLAARNINEMLNNTAKSSSHTYIYTHLLYMSMLAAININEM